MRSPTMPTTMRMTPMVDSSTPEIESVIANLRMAPMAMRNRLVPIPMQTEYPDYHPSHADAHRRVLDPAGASGLPRHDSPDRSGADRTARGGDRRDGRVPVGRPQAARRERHPRSPVRRGPRR